ncbi:MAG: hypothetical protein H5U40_03000, partial [Polyangiaceae bacterium]|nr:hypothetical protein [Polyangiaceae bacterium]
MRALEPWLVIPFLALAACGGGQPEADADGIGRDELLPAPPPAEPVPDEPTIAHGIAKEERVFVRLEPAETARALGIVRIGRQFEISERREVEG